MGVLLRDALRRLCVEIGWSYAVFWRAIGFRDPMHLVWEDGHCERLPNISGYDAMDMLLKEKRAARIAGNDRIAEIACRAEDRLGSLVRKTMVAQVHVVGDGVIGQAALMGSHRWILRDMLDGSASNVLAEMSPQFLAGIQTIVIIPVLPFGVVQLGSTKMVIENIGFINHVKSLFSHLGSVPGVLLADTNNKALSKNSQVCSSSAMPASNILSGDSCVQTIRPLPTIAHDLQDRRLASRSVTQPYSLPFKHINGTLEYSLSKLPMTSMATATTRTTHCEKFQQIVDPMVKPSHPNNELETSPLMSLSNPGVTLTQQVPAYNSLSGSGTESSLMTSGLCLDSLITPEKLLDSMSTSGSLENNPTVKNSELLRVRSSKREGCDPLKTKEGIMTSHVAPSSIKTSQIPNKVKDSKGLQAILEPSSSLCPLEKDSQNLVTSGKQNRGNDLFETVEVLPTEFGKSDSCCDSLFGTLLDCWTSLDVCEEKQRFSNAGIDTEAVMNSQEKIREDPGFLDTVDEKSLRLLKQPYLGNDLFDALGVEYKLTYYPGSSDVAVHKGQVNAPELDLDVSTCTTQLDSSCFYDSLNHENQYGSIFLEDCHDQLLDAVVSKAKSCAKQKSDDGISCKTSITHTSGSSFHPSSSASGWVASSEQMQNNILGHSSVLLKTEAAVSNPAKSACSTDKTADCSVGYGSYKSQISPWVENSQGGNCDSASVAQCRRADDTGKCTRKRSRPGENPRPRPKDRQMIQDRVKELREIVPNGAKCSIDALLEKTIKHMLFLQCVTKHADKLKEAGEPKIVSKEGGLLLKDNFEGGATWAFEVGTQSMICPIIVEDLNPPRQMHVEMLCEERGFFLEIADMIRGLGLTILKGVMEARDDKIWARFAVEANRDVTRMEVFLSLVRLLEPIMGNRMAPMGADNVAMPQTLAQQASIPATGLSNCLG